MRVIVAGGHGQIGLQLLRLVAERGDEAVGLIRKPEQVPDLEAFGAQALVCDLEGEDEISLEGDAVVFAAGAGPGSGAERKWTMDYGGAVKLMRAGVRRYVMVSAMGAADPPPEGGDVFGEYIRAKAKADRELAASGLDSTIVRPGRLTDGEPTGRVRAGERLERGEIPRADVAATLLAVLDEPSTIGKAFDLVSGDDPIAEAVARIRR
jgi:uncharacterized protein YbjT (DUF2867 family)